MTNYIYSTDFLNEPILVTDQVWPDGTMPLVSVSSLVYNHVEFLDRCIRGLLQQKTTFPIEIIFHDDASNDGSTEIINSYIEKYPNLIKLVLQSENIYHNDIRRIEDDLHQYRRGKYIANCEGDDYWIDPLKLEMQFQFLEKNSDFTGIHTQVQYVDKKGGIIGYSNKVAPHLEVSNFEDHIRSSMIHSVSFMYRREVLEINNKFIWQLSSHYYDQYLFIITALNGKIKYVNSLTAAYRMNVGVSKSWNRFSKSLYAEECVEFFLTLPLNKSQQIAAYKKLKSVYSILYCCYAKSNDALALSYLKKYFNTIRRLYLLMSIGAFLKLLVSVEFILMRGLFWHIMLFVSAGKIKPRGLS